MSTTVIAATMADATPVMVIATASTASTTASLEHLVSLVVGHLVSFLLVTVPATVISYVTRLLSWSLVLTVDTRGLALLAVAAAALAYVVIHRVYLTRYARLPPPPVSQKPAGASFDLHPDATGFASDDSRPPGFNYAEEFLGSFLQSIKVFGYMEQPVFTELARRLQTRKLPAGDMLFSADDPGAETNFYIVVEGCVQVYVKTSSADASSLAHHPLDAVTPGASYSAYSGQQVHGHMPPPPLQSNGSFCNYPPPPDPNEPLPGHTLLNEVEAGGTVSSLFSILDLLSSTLGDGDDGSIAAAATAQARARASAFAPGPNVPPVPSIPTGWAATTGMAAGPSPGTTSGRHPLATPIHLTESAPTSPEHATMFGAGGATDGPNNGSSPSSSLSGDGTVFPKLGLSSVSPPPLSNMADAMAAALHVRTSSAPTNGSVAGGPAPSAAGSSTWGRRSRHSSAGHDMRLPGGMPPSSVPNGWHSRTPSTLHGGGGGGSSGAGAGRGGDGGPGSPMLETGMSARAARDTTLLVIPAEAFLRLLDKYPHAAAHIALVILTRFQRVTGAALAQYLGMPAALLAIDQQLHEYAAPRSGGFAPSMFRPGGLERLRRRFHVAHSVFRGHVRAGTATGAGGVPTMATPSSILGTGTAGGLALGIVEGNMSSQHGMESRSAAGTTATVARDMDGLASPPLSRRASLTAAHLASLSTGTTGGGSSRSSTEDVDAHHHQRAAALAAATTPRTRKARAMDAEGIATHHHHSGGEKGAVAAGSVSSGDGAAEGVNTWAFDDAEEESYLRQSVFASMLYAIGLRDAAGAIMLDGSVTVSDACADNPPGPGHVRGPQHRRASGNPGMARGGGYSPAAAGGPTGGMPGWQSAAFMGSRTSMSSSASATSAVSEVDTSDIEIRFYRKGTPLVPPGQPVDGLFLVIDGLISVSTPHNVAPATALGAGLAKSARKSSGANSNDNSSNSNNGAQRAMPSRQSESGEFGSPRRAAGPAHQYFVRPGGIAGYMPALTGHTSCLNMEARTDLCVGFMPKHAIDRLVDRQPTVILTLAQRLVSVVSPLVMHIDYALEWDQVNAGHVLYHQGDAPNAIYMVLSGRLRTIAEKSNGTFEVVSEHGQGESVGEQEVLMDTPRPHTTHAIRDTEIARMPSTLFDALALRHPEITLAMARIIAGRSQQYLQDARVSAGIPTGFSSSRAGVNLGKNNANLRTVAVLPVHNGVPVLEFSDKLHAALVHTLGESSLLLTQATVLSVLGKHAFTQMGKLKLMSWLGEQETRHRIVLYVADGGIKSIWTQRCIRQADCILLVAVGDHSPAIGEYERYMLGVKTTARKELVLLHPGRSCPHGLTQKWLDNRLWIHGHHHVAMNLDRYSAAFLDSASSSSFSRSPADLASSSSARGSRGSLSHLPLRHRKPTYAGNGPLFEDLGLAGAIGHLKGTLMEYVRQYGGRFGIARPASSASVADIGARSDFARLGRRLCGRSIGLVLGGGGARGISQVGVIRALEEAGIPIDMVGGTSIGSMVGGLYARDVDHVSVMGRLKVFSWRMASKWRTLLDLTYPVTSYLTGHQMCALCFPLSMDASRLI
ncbi:hypothetical protein BC828DRAFT_373915 [Blastocladiella britannica]|nr:hypothetical protein BC828DRAFT_373915 [Blastocladiella britannica]